MVEEAKIELPVVFGMKAGMTRVFDKEGNHVPVTVVKIIPNNISQVKTKEKHGYSAYQVGYGEKRQKLVSRPIQGQLKKAGIPKNYVHFAEVRQEDTKEENQGKEVSLIKFAPGAFVDVQGTTKGKGFQGVMKRYKFQGGPAAHGSHFHRGTGSIGNRATPGRVFPQKKMPGQMGNVVRTVQNLKIFSVDLEKGYMLVRGSLPGPKNSYLRISRSIKKVQ